MGTFYPIQTAFNAGEWSGRMRGRVDAPAYKTGLGLCLNWEPLAQGPLRMRAGTEHVATLTSTSPLARILSFPIAGRQDFVLELGNLFLKAYDANGIVSGSGADGGYTNLVQNGDFSNGIAYWTIVAGTVSAPDYFGGCLLNSADARIRTSVAVTGAGVHVLKLLLTTAGDLANEALRIRVGTTPGGAELYEGEHGSNGFAVPISVNVTTAGAGTVYLDFESDGSQSPWPAPWFSSVEFLSPATAGSGVVSLVSPWPLDKLAQVQYVAETGSGNDRMIFVHPSFAPQVLQRSSANVWTFGPAVFTPNAPAEWTGSGYPSAVELHNGRAYYTAGNQIWASKSGTLFDFTMGAPLLPGDALDVKVLTKGLIRWVREGYALLLGTDLGAHMYTGANGQPLNGDQFVRRVPGVSSAAIQAIDTGSEVLYVSSDRRRIHALQYNERNGWGSRDVLYLADHLTASGVKEIHHLFAPDGVIVGVLYSGGIIACAYNPEQEVVAWWRVTASSGPVRSAAVSRGPREGYLWLAVERAGAIHLERLPLTEGALVLRYLDASVQKAADANGTVTGITHLTGTVRVVANGDLAGDFEIAAGAIALGADYANASVIVGLPYTARAETLPLEGGNPAGTAQGLKRKFIEINARLNDSAIPKINGQRPEERSFGDALDSPTARITDDVQVKNEEGWGNKAVIVIEQDLPFRTEVCALYGPVKVNA